MAIDYETFQSAPCDYSTYKYIMDGTISEKWNVGEKDTILSAITVRIENDDGLIAYVTNLPVINHTTHKGVKIPVCVLNELSINDSFDPTGTTAPEPTMNCSFSLTSINETLTNSQLDSIIKELKNTNVTVFRYFVKCDLRDLRDDNGDFKQEVTRINYFKPVDQYIKEEVDDRSHKIRKQSIFGPYTVKNVSYNYNSQTILLDCDLLGYDIMKNTLTFDKDSCMIPQYVRYLSRTATTPRNEYLTCFNPVLETIDPKNARCNYESTVNPNYNLTRNIDFNQIVALYNNPDFPCYKWDDFFDYYPNRLDPDAEKPDIKIFTKLNANYTFYPLYSYLKNKTYLDCFRELALMNNLYVLPCNYTFKDVSPDITLKFETLKFNSMHVGGVVFRPNPDNSVTVTGKPNGLINPVCGFYKKLKAGTYYFKADGGTRGLVEFEILPDGETEPKRVCCGDTAIVTLNENKRVEFTINAGSKNDPQQRNTTITCSRAYVKLDASKASWRIVGGKKPNKYVFPDDKQTIVKDDHLGQYYNTTNDLYLISQNCIIDKSESKDEVALNTVKYVNTSDVKILEDFEVVEKGNVKEITNKESATKTFKLPTQPTNTDPAFVSASTGLFISDLNYKYYSEYLRDYVLPSNNNVTLPEGEWYDIRSETSTLNGATGKSLAFGEVVGVDTTYDNADYTASLIDGRTLQNPIGLYNPNLKLRYLNSYITNVDRHKPFSVTLRTVSPTFTKLDKEGKSSAELNDNEHSLDTTFVSQIKHKDALPVILDRANAVNMKPLYGLEWTMLDDPFLRIGTIVYYPLNNRYVEVLITEQTRTYSNGSRLRCKGWVLRETDMFVVDNRDKSTVYSGEVKAQSTIVPLMDNHWLRG